MKKRLRQYLALLCIVICVFSLTACSEEKSAKVTYTDETAEKYVALMEENGYEVEDIEADIQSEVDGVVNIIIQNLILQDRDELLELYSDDENSIAIAESYLEATKDLGEYKDDSVYDLKLEISDDTMTTTGSFVFEKRDLNFTCTVDLAAGTTTFAFERELTLGEILQKAGMNTLLGMGSVFLVLILISFIISCFKLFSKTEGEAKTKEVVTPVMPVAAPAAPAEPAPEALGMPDEVEMAIVIATAIAAAEEETGSDGYRVRSIKRAKNSKWRRA